MFPSSHQCCLSYGLKWILCLGLLLIVMQLTDSCYGQESVRPNIVLIMADDLGFADLGCYGSEIDTPNLDQLAKNGIQCTQFYNTAKCHSSRVSLLTGLYCDQAGAESLERGTTIAKQLRDCGYFTAMVGKWHLEKQPTDQGFNRYFGHLSGATNYFTGDNTFRLNGKEWNDFDENFYTTVRNADYAINFLDEAISSQQPFFLYAAFNAPHYPLQVLQKDFEKYRQRYQAGWDAIRARRFTKQSEMELFSPGTVTDLGRPDHVPAWESLTTEEQAWEADRMAAFAGMVDCLDREIGRMVTFLKSKGAWENTLLIFVSDNGACPFERTKGREFAPYDSRSYWTYDTGWAHVGNTPFRYYKQNNHEGGIASPAIFHWPKGISVPGTRVDTPAHLIDLMPTCLQLGGGKYVSRSEKPNIEPLMGVSLAPLFSGQDLKQREYLYFHFGSNRALRQGDWKTVSFRSGPWELYEVSTDRNEARNVAAEHPNLVKQMSDKWHQIAEEVDRLPAKQRGPVGPEPQGGPMQKNGK
ncbi:MAG: arylsulfatase [Planctomycetales bacterium]|nr:arylsulfatase [Planctomycetales bacterium]